MPRNCMYNTINGCTFAYDPATEMPLYAAHLEGHTASAPTIPTTTVPDLSGLMTREQIEARLATANLLLGEYEERTVQWTPLGPLVVVPAPTTRVAVGSTVKVVNNVVNPAGYTPVPGAPAPAPVIPAGAFAMPNLERLTIDEANKILPHKAKINKANVALLYDDDVKEGRIISFQPAEGQVLWPNDPRNPRVTVSAGKNPRDRRHLVPDWF